MSALGGPVCQLGHRGKIINLKCDLNERELHLTAFHSHRGSIDTALALVTTKQNVYIKGSLSAAPQHKRNFPVSDTAYTKPPDLVLSAGNLAIFLAAAQPRPQPLREPSRLKPCCGATFTPASPSRTISL